jgi:four helix bundle protein
MKVYKVEELETYRLAFELQQLVFEKTKSWPKEESYSLIDQIRRSSRSVGSNLCEAWTKREYPSHFHSKLTDADGELLETGHWLRSASACGYLSGEEFEKLETLRKETGGKLGRMIKNSDNFCIQRKKQ